jgi:hypothetical protein
LSVKTKSQKISTAYTKLWGLCSLRKKSTWRSRREKVGFGDGGGSSGSGVASGGGGSSSSSIVIYAIRYEREG